MKASIDQRDVDVPGAQPRARLVGVLGDRHRVSPAGQRRRDVVALRRVAMRDERVEAPVLLARPRRQQHA